MYYFGSEAHCEFANIGNLLFVVGETCLATYLHDNIDKYGESLLCSTDYSHLGEHKYSRLHIGMKMLLAK